MRSRYIFVTMLAAIIFAVILAQRAAGSLPGSRASETGSQPERAAAAEAVEVQIAEPTPTTDEPAATQEGRNRDGQVVLEAHCTQCHTAQMLEQINQPRADWEKSLAKMEGFGVTVNETEKAVLLDYLSAK